MGSELHQGPVGNWKTAEGSKCQVLVEEGGELWLWGPVHDLVWVHLLPI